MTIKTMSIINKYRDDFFRISLLIAVVTLAIMLFKSCVAPTNLQKNIASEMNISSAKLIENACGLKKMCGHYRETAIMCITSSNFDECAEKFGGAEYYLCEVNGNIASEKINKISPSTAQCLGYNFKLFVKDHFRPDFFEKFKE